MNIGKDSIIEWSILSNISKDLFWENFMAISACSSLSKWIAAFLVCFKIDEKVDGLAMLKLKIIGSKDMGVKELTVIPTFKSFNFVVIT